jgi:hypothetical protein
LRDKRFVLNDQDPQLHHDIYFPRTSMTVCQPPATGPTVSVQPPGKLSSSRPLT